jgi:DNA helicase HerA-like ATPase
VHERWLVLGKTHTGKSTFAKAEVRALLRNHRVIALDVTDEWSQQGRVREGVDLGPLLERMTVQQLCATPAKITAARLSLAVVPDAQTSQSAARAFELIVRLQKHSPRSVVLVLDEAHVWAPYVTALYNDAATLGRHWGGGMALISVSQRANRVPLTVRSQSSRIISFTQDEPADVEGLAAKTGRPFAEAAARLPPHAFLEWRDSATPTEAPSPVEH